MDSTKPIYKYLIKQNSQIVDLITQGQHLHELNNLIKPIINQVIGNQLLNINLAGEELTLMVGSAELANRLRYQTANLLGEIKRLEGCAALNKINIKVGPASGANNQVKKPEKKSTLMHSNTGQRYLQLLADDIQDPLLKASLRRLAEHVSP